MNNGAPPLKDSHRTQSADMVSSSSANYFENLITTSTSWLRNWWATPASLFEQNEMISVSGIAQLLLSLHPLPGDCFSKWNVCLPIWFSAITAISREPSFSYIYRLIDWQKRYFGEWTFSQHIDKLSHLDGHPLINEFCRRTSVCFSFWLNAIHDKCEMFAQ